MINSLIRALGGVTRFDFEQSRTMNNAIHEANARTIAVLQAKIELIEFNVLAEKQETKYWKNKFLNFLGQGDDSNVREPNNADLEPIQTARTPWTIRKKELEALDRSRIALKRDQDAATPIEDIVEKIEILED